MWDFHSLVYKACPGRCRMVDRPGKLSLNLLHPGRGLRLRDPETILVHSFLFYHLFGCSWYHFDSIAIYIRITLMVVSYTYCFHVIRVVVFSMNLQSILSRSMCGCCGKASAAGSLWKAVIGWDKRTLTPSQPTPRVQAYWRPNVQRIVGLNPQRCAWTLVTSHAASVALWEATAVRQLFKQQGDPDSFLLLHSTSLFFSTNNPTPSHQLHKKFNMDPTGTFFIDLPHGIY